MGRVKKEPEDTPSSKDGTGAIKMMDEALPPYRVGAAALSSVTYGIMIQDM